MLNHITDDDLRDMYWTQNLSGKEIAKRLGCSPAAVCMRMKASGIMARKRWEYPATEKQRVTWIRIGKQSAGKKRSAKTRKAISESRTGFRAKEYEFGGHEKKRADGYIVVFVPNHPHATADGYVAKHTLVMERHIGRYLNKDEVVHHINHIRDDNRLENLKLMTKHDHMSMHMRERHHGKE